ncbi:MAG: tetratricopeptide repeat protein, partial [Acidobacteriia bacterium]|nr:tetratricopeptide repeat protein [Terriglobia bacterium]
YGQSKNSYGSSNSSVHQTYRTDSDRDSERCRHYNGSPKICRPRGMGYPIYLAGRVALASGEALYEPVRIAITCGGHAIPQVYTDARGRFNFQPKCRPLLALSDASLRSFSLYPGFGQGLTTTTGTANLMGCELFAELPGHWSTRVRLGLVAAPARNEVGLIILSPLDNSTGRSVSVTTLTAPPGAKKAYWNGLRALRKRKPDFRKAANLFERAVKLHPEHAQAWAALGEARAALGEADRAKEAFARSIQSDPELLQPYDAMIRIAARNRDWAHLDSLATKYLKLAPGSSRVRFYSAVAAWELGDIARTESTIKQMEELGELDGWPMSYVIMALAHERRADFETAADYYEQYIEISVDAEISSLARRAIYDWGHLQVIETRPVTLAHAAEPE